MEDRHRHFANGRPTHQVAGVVAILEQLVSTLVHKNVHQLSQKVVVALRVHLTSKRDVAELGRCVLVGWLGGWVVGWL